MVGNKRKVWFWGIFFQRLLNGSSQYYYLLWVIWKYEYQQVIQDCWDKGRGRQTSEQSRNKNTAWILAWQDLSVDLLNRAKCRGQSIWQYCMKLMVRAWVLALQHCQAKLLTYAVTWGFLLLKTWSFHGD